MFKIKKIDHVAVATDDIDDRAVSKTSIMPPGQVNQLASRQQFLDLIRYLIDIRDGGPARARELQPPPALFALQLAEYESRVDHAGLIRDLNDESLRRGAATIALSKSLSFRWLAASSCRRGRIASRVPYSKSYVQTEHFCTVAPDLLISGSRRGPTLTSAAHAGSARRLGVCRSHGPRGKRWESRDGSAEPDGTGVASR